MSQVTQAQLDKRIRLAVKDANGEAIGLKALRRQLEEEFGLPFKSLDERKEEIKAILVQAMNTDEIDSEDSVEIQVDNSAEAEAEERARSRSQRISSRSTRRATITDNMPRPSVSVEEPEPEEVRGKDRAGQQADFEGFLKKRGDQGRLRMWRKRFFRLYKKEGIIAYFKNDADMHQLGEISVVGAFMLDKRDDIGKFAFTITMKTTARIWVLQAKDEGERESWLSACAPLMKESLAIAPGQKLPKPPRGAPLRFPPTYVQGWEARDSCASTIQNKFDWTGLVQQSADQVPLADGAVALTIQGEVAVVEEVRKLDLVDGVATIDNLPEQLKYTMGSVQWSAPDSQLTQARFVFDAKTQSSLLRKLVGKKITTLNNPSNTSSVEYTGILARTEGQDRYALVDEDNNTVHFLKDDALVSVNLQDVDRTSLPDGVVFREPQIQGSFKGAGAQLGQLTYSLEDAFEAHVSYAVTLNSDETKADINGWFSVQNKTSKTFENARIAIISTPSEDEEEKEPEEEASGGLLDGVSVSAGVGAVARPRIPGVPGVGAVKVGGLGNLAGNLLGGLLGDKDQDEEVVDPIHHYPVDAPITLPAQDWAHASFLSSQVSAQALHLATFDTPAYQIKPITAANAGEKAVASVNTVVRFNNPLKVALPTGSAKINRREMWGHGARQVSVTDIERVEGGEAITINLEKTAGISVSRKQTGYNFDAEKHFMIETFEITVVNGRQELCEINIEDSLFRWESAEITSSWPKHAQTAHPRRIGWTVRLNSGEDITIKYTVFYSDFELPSDYE